MNTTIYGPALRIARHSDKDFTTGELTPQGEEKAKKVGVKDFGSNRVNRMISSSSERVQKTIALINQGAEKPFAGNTEVKNYLGLETGLDKSWLQEFFRRMEEYEKDTVYIAKILEQITQEGISGDEAVKNRKLEIIQDQVADDYLHGKFDVKDIDITKLIIKRMDQFLQAFSRGKLTTSEDKQADLVLGGTHQGINEGFFRVLRGNDMPAVWKEKAVGYAEWVHYQPVKVQQEDGKEEDMLKIKFRGHTEYVPVSRIHEIRTLQEEGK